MAQTTKILAVGIGTEAFAANPDQVKQLLPQEVRETLALHIDGTIEQWFSRVPGGVVFLLSETDEKTAMAKLSALPLAHAGLMRFELTSLTPLQPLRFL